MGERVLESIFKFEKGIYTIRVWAKRNVRKQRVEEVIEEIINSIWIEGISELAPAYISDKVADELIDEINAIEVLWKNGEGDLAYNDWP